MSKRKKKAGGRKLKLADHPDVECRDCEKGKRFCSESRPCWGTPEDVSRLLDAGYADRLMLDWYAKDGGVDYYVVSPAAQGFGPPPPEIAALMGLSGVEIDHGPFGGKIAPGVRSHQIEEYVSMGPKGLMLAGIRQALGMELLNSGCVLLTDEGLCSLHDAGLKPTEGRKSCCKNGVNGEGFSLHLAVGKTWNTEAGRAVVARWRELTGCQDEG